MSNIFKDFVLARPVKTPLDFGHNTNIVIEDVDFEIRKKKGIVLKANTFVKLTKVDDDRTPIASTEINFWDLDPTKDFVYENFITQFSVLCGIVDAVGGDAEKYEVDVLGVVEGNDDAEMLKFLKNPTNAKAAQTVLSAAFKEQVSDKIGLNSALLKCKMVSNKSGFLQPASDMMWILPMDSEESLPPVTPKEQRVYEKALKSDNKSTPDTTGNAPENNGESLPEKTISASSLASI